MSYLSPNQPVAAYPAPRGTTAPEADLARVDVADLMEGNRVMHLTLNDQVYTLRITRAQKLILTK
jgi:hemin uptake protein HemP